MRDWRILVVDDEVGILRSIERILQSAYEVRTCTNASDAIAMATSMKPDLAIVDIMMPQMDGFQLMEQLLALNEDTAVILMTGSVHETDEKLIRAIRGRAFYFINKPFDREVLLTLVDRCLSQKRLELADRAHADHMRRQLNAASAFQRAMLPTDRATVHGFEVAALYVPCEDVAGDFFEYAASGDDAVTVLIADVVGHGASAAMLTAVVKSAFHKARSDNYRPDAVVQRVCEDMAAFSADQFLTMTCARISRATRTIEFVNAGHVYGLLRDSDCGLQELVAESPVVSPCLAGVLRPLTTIHYSEGSTLFLYTDGVVEAFNDADEPYGYERLTGVIQNAQAAGTESIQAVYADVKKHMGGRAPNDDLTMLAVVCP